MIFHNTLYFSLLNHMLKKDHVTHVAQHPPVHHPLETLSDLVVG